MDDRGAADMTEDVDVLEPVKDSDSVRCGNCLKVKWSSRPGRL